MVNKVKKAHTIRVAGVSCLNGEYKLNVSGRNMPLQLFQVAIPGETTFKFVKLPQVLSKRDAVAYLLNANILEKGEVAFLTNLLKAYDAKLNKVPGKRGRPKGSKNKVTAEKLAKKLVKAGAKVKKTKAVVAKEIKAMVEPVEPTPVKAPVTSDAEKQRIMEANREKLRAVARTMKQKVA